MEHDDVIRRGSHYDWTGAEGLSGTNASRRILLIDPCAMTRESLQSLLMAHFFAVDAVSHVPDQTTAGLVLLHIGAARMDQPDTHERIASVRERCVEDAGIAVISDLADAALAIAAIRRGLRGYLPTHLSAGMVAAGVGVMRAGGIFIPPESIPALCGEAPEAKPASRAIDDLILTGREGDVLLALQKGNPNKIIAHELRIAESTVKVHVRNIMKKLNATNRTQLAFLTRRLTASERGEAGF